MKVLYILFEEVIPSRGVSKKILSQCNGLRANGAEVDLFNFKSCNNEFYAVVNDEPIHSYGRNGFKYLRFLLEFNHIIKYIKDNHINAVYIRFSRSSPFMIFLFRALKKNNIIVLLEIPTYPYDSEGTGAQKLHWKLYLWFLFKIDRVARSFFKYYIDRIVTVQNYDTIFGVPTIKISNGVDLQKIPIRKCKSNKGYNLIGVAQMGFWHGYDRLIEGIGLYYKNGGDKEIHFYAIGNNENVIDVCKELACKYDIEDHIHFEGPKEGEDLDEYFNNADFAIGSLAGHRKGLFDAKPLKCVEYAARGIPFVYSENNTDFDDCTFILKVSQSDAPIDMYQIINFIDNFNLDPSVIRNYVEEKLTWDIQMKKVHDEIRYL